MKKNKGFSYIEIFVAASLVLMLAILFIPIGAKLHLERQTLNEKRIIAQALHDELLSFLWNKTPAVPQSYTKQLLAKKLTFEFVQEKAYWKGCANWKNAKQKQDKLCFYGIPKK